MRCEQCTGSTYNWEKCRAESTDTLGEEKGCLPTRSTDPLSTLSACLSRWPHRSLSFYSLLWSRTRPYRDIMRLSWFWIDRDVFEGFCNFCFSSGAQGRIFSIAMTMGRIRPVLCQIRSLICLLKFSAQPIWPLHSGLNLMTRTVHDAWRTYPSVLVPADFVNDILLLYFLIKLLYNQLIFFLVIDFSLLNITSL
jgi:hypothetical protein